MNGASRESDDAEGETLRERVEAWLAREMPIIQMHGGTSAVRKADPEDGEVVIELGGTCAGCGISDVTVGNIEGQLYQDFPEIEELTVRTPDVGADQWEREGDESIMGIDLSEGGRG
jgi:Fe-S cluster biogenesis protein NfuA